MSNYVKIRSFHDMVTFTRDGGALTRCGLRAHPPLTVADQLPGSGRSCESCLKLTRRDEEKGSGLD